MINKMASELITVKILLQLLLIISFSKIISLIARKVLKQTNVAGEILAGILLGPSCLTMMFPNLMNIIFAEETTIVFNGLAQIGLIFLMFQIGMEFNFSKKLGSSKITFILISVTGIISPFVLGFFSAEFFWQQLPSPRPEIFSFQLFFAVAMSITAIPILGRIFIELNYSHTRTASLIISAAAIDDVVGWLLLSIITALVTSSFAIFSTIQNIFLLMLFLILIRLFGKKVVSPYLTRTIRKYHSLNYNCIFFIVTGVLGCAIVTSYLGVFAIIGGFIFGFSLHENRKFVNIWELSIGRFVNVFFLPLFFAYTGLRTNIGLLNGVDEILQTILICLIAFIGKFAGTYLISRILKETHINALIIGFSMNTRALMELIVLNVGYELNIIPQKIFTMLVIMAVVSTFIITPILKLLISRIDLSNA